MHCRACLLKAMLVELFLDLFCACCCIKTNIAQLAQRCNSQTKRLSKSIARIIHSPFLYSPLPMREQSTACPMHAVHLLRSTKQQAGLTPPCQHQHAMAHDATTRMRPRQTDADNPWVVPSEHDPWLARHTSHVHCIRHTAAATPTNRMTCFTHQERCRFS